jgi:pimeloyl-ACP methyl ester carboxylesterase
MLSMTVRRFAVTVAVAAALLAGCVGTSQARDAGTPDAAIERPTSATTPTTQPAQPLRARTGYARVNGLQMYYEIHGSGAPLVLLHGAFTTIDISFGALLPELAQTRQVIAVEQQAHGHTGDIDRPLSYEQMADDTAALLRKLNIKEADFLGYSMGANIALQVAIRHPDLVDRLVVLSAYFDNAGLYPGVLEGIAQITPETFIGSGLPEAYAAVAPNPDDWAVLVEKAKQLDLTFEGWPASAIASIEAPTLVVVGDSDTVRTGHATEMFELVGGGVPGDFAGLPDDQLAVLPGTTHLGLITERTDQLFSMTTAFLDAETGGH